MLILVFCTQDFCLTIAPILSTKTCSALGSSEFILLRTHYPNCLLVHGGKKYVCYVQRNWHCLYKSSLIAPAKKCLNSMLFLMKTLKYSQKKHPFKQEATDFKKKSLLAPFSLNMNTAYDFVLSH